MLVHCLWCRFFLDARDRTFGQMSAEELSLGLATYIGAHFSLVGWSMDTGVPIPPSQPEDLPDMTFMQYLDALGIGYLKNLFQ